jgi:hypothetical protein
MYMTELSIYKDKSTTSLLHALQTTIRKLQERSDHKAEKKVKSIIRTLKNRELTATQYATLNRLLVRFFWI